MRRLPDPGMQLRPAVPAAPPPVAADTAVHEAQPAAAVLSPEEAEEEEARRRAFVTGGDLILQVRLDEGLDLEFDVSLRVRVETDAGYVQKYRRRFEKQLADGVDPADECPPLVAFVIVPPGVDPKAYRGRLRPAKVVAGWHRTPAAQAAGVQRLRCVIKVGTWWEAYEYAVQDNQAHGKDLTEGDRRHMVLPFLQDPYWREKNISTNWIRRKCGVGSSVIEELRRELKDREARAKQELPPEKQELPPAKQKLPRGADPVCTPQGSALESSTGESVTSETPAAEPERRLGRDNRRRRLPQPRVESIRANQAIKDVEAKLGQVLGTEVKVRPKSWKRGEVVIPYKSLDEMDALIKRFEALQAPRKPAGKRK